SLEPADAVTVPPAIVPPASCHSPPYASRSNVPLLFSVPVIFSAPPVRETAPIAAGANVPASESVPPFTVNVPVELVHVPLTLTVPPSNAPTPAEFWRLLTFIVPPSRASIVPVLLTLVPTTV